MVQYELPPVGTAGSDSSRLDTVAQDLEQRHHVCALEEPAHGGIDTVGIGNQCTPVRSPTVRFYGHTLHWDIATSHGRPARTDPLNTFDKAYRHRVTEAAAIAHGRLSHEFDKRSHPGAAPASCSIRTLSFTWEA